MSEYFSHKPIERFVHNGTTAFLSGGASVMISNGELFISDGGRHTITYRSIQDYLRMGLPLDLIERGRDRIRVLEVGVGLSEFLPWFAQRARHRPVAVGPDNYFEMQRLCETVAESEGISEKTRSLASTLAERARVMTSSSVDLINLEFDQALAELERRGERFDVVISIASITFGAKDKVNPIKKALTLLKPEGIYVPQSDLALYKVDRERLSYNRFNTRLDFGFEEVS